MEDGEVCVPDIPLARSEDDDLDSNKNSEFVDLPIISSRNWKIAALLNFAIKSCICKLRHQF